MPSFLSDARDYGAVLGQGSLLASFFQGARSEHRPVQGKSGILGRVTWSAALVYIGVTLAVWAHRLKLSRQPRQVLACCTPASQFRCIYIVYLKPTAASVCENTPCVRRRPAQIMERISEKGPGVSVLTIWVGFGRWREHYITDTINIKTCRWTTANVPLSKALIPFILWIYCVKVFERKSVTLQCGVQTDS